MSDSLEMEVDVPEITEITVRSALDELDETKRLLAESKLDAEKKGRELRQVNSELFATRALLLGVVERSGKDTKSLLGMVEVVKKLKAIAKCGVCEADIENAVLFTCGHMYCKRCVLKAWCDLQKEDTERKAPYCPRCPDSEEPTTTVVCGLSDVLRSAAKVNTENPLAVWNGRTAC